MQATLLRQLMAKLESVSLLSFPGGYAGAEVSVKRLMVGPFAR